MVNSRSMDRRYCKIYESMVNTGAMDEKILQNILVNGKCEAFDGTYYKICQKAYG